MKLQSLISTLPVLAAALAFVLPQAVHAQTRVSPHEAIYGRVGRSLVSVVYGRPYSKDPKTGEIRKIWGGLNPYGKVWRLGSDEATMLMVEKPVMLGDTQIPAGAYTLFLLPEADGSAKLIVNKQVGQWGLTYDASQDFARIDVKKDATPAQVDQFTMALKPNKPGLLMTMTWENIQYSVPIMPVAAPAKST